jgi:hypothetical protein
MQIQRVLEHGAERTLSESLFMEGALKMNEPVPCFSQRGQALVEIEFITNMSRRETACLYAEMPDYIGAIAKMFPKIQFVVFKYRRASLN